MIFILFIKSLYYLRHELYFDKNNNFQFFLPHFSCFRFKPIIKIQEIKTYICELNEIF